MLRRRDVLMRSTYFRGAQHIRPGFLNPVARFKSPPSAIFGLILTIDVRNTKSSNGRVCTANQE